jgi:CopG antitoxin of type II toxin-antitoxin system
MAKIPKFKTLDEAAEFWDAHDFEEYVDDTEPVEFTVRIPERTTTLRIPVELTVYERIEALAAKKRVPIEKLVASWLKEKVTAGSK